MKSYKLTTPQQNIWNLQSFYDDSGIMNIAGVVWLDKPLRKSLLSNIVNQFVEKNNAMRIIVNHEGRQIIREHSNLILEDIDYSEMSNQQIDKKLNERSRQSMGLINQNLFEFTIIKRKTDWGLYVKISHLIADAWGISYLVKEVFGAYFALLSDKEYELNRSDYTEFIKTEEAYLKSSRYERDKNYFDELFNKKPSLLSFKKNNQVNNIAAKRKGFALTKRETAAIKTYCEENNISPAILFEAAMAVYLYRYFNEERLIIGMPVINRSNYSEKNTMGMFVSTMPLVVDVESNMKAKDLMTRIVSQHFELFKHQKFPFGEIQNLLKNKFDYKQKLFDVAISYQNAEVSVDGQTLNNNWYFNGFNENSLMLHVIDFFNEGKIKLSFDYATSAFSSKEIIFLKRRLITIVENIINDDQRRIDEISIMDEKESNLINSFNDTFKEYDTNLTVVDLFKKAALRNPNKIALIYEEKEYTYQELDNITDQVAATLIEKGINRGDIVMLLTKRSKYTIFGMLGVIKAGAAYMPIDINNPDGRIDALIHDTKTKLILGYQHNYSNKDKVPEISFEDIELCKNKKCKVKYNLTSSDIYCAMHTSGSTGSPKSVSLTHQGFVNVFVNHAFLTEGAKYAITNIVLSFDLFLMETIHSIVNSITCVLTNEEQFESINKYCDLVAKYPDSYIMGVPTKLLNIIHGANNKEAFKNVVIYTMCGEPLPDDFPKLIKEISPKAKLYNLYGPVEATIFATYTRIKKKVYLGKPNFNTVINVVDKNDSILPIGFVGEIVISGEQVGKGYYTQLKKSGFKNGSYYTGDLGYYDYNGNLHYSGRLDNQVKINGLRVEFGEIEAQILNNADLKSVKATIVKIGNGQRIIAYYVSDSELDVDDLLKKLGQKLPSYMIPAAFVKVKEFHFTPRGKIDIKKLPKPIINKCVTKKFVRPSNELEKRILKIWQKVLDKKEIGTTDDFFEIGGDSITAITMLSLVENHLEIDISIRNIFDNPTIQKLSSYIEYQHPSQKMTLELPAININHKKNRNSSILLTGATGYLGAYLLKHILDNSDEKVNIIIRNEKKLERVFKYYFSKEYRDYKDRINIYIGDLSKSKFNLSAKDYELLLSSTKVIIHAAANVMHYGKISSFYDANVLATLNLLNFAAENNSSFNHISTLSISGHDSIQKIQEEIVFTEKKFNVGQDLSNNYYLHSKYLAEEAVVAYQKAGLSANIFRIGNVGPSLADNQFQINANDNAFYIRIKAIKKLGMITKEMAKQPIEVSHVDRLSEAIISLINTGEINNTYHILNDYMTLECYLEEQNIKFGIVSKKTFNKKLIDFSKDDDVQILLLYTKDFANNGKIIIDDKVTKEKLNKLGFNWRGNNE